MKTTLACPSISEMTKAGYDLIYSLDFEKIKNKTDFFKECNENWFFSPIKIGQKIFIECWKKTEDFEKDVQIAETNWN